MLNDNSRVPGEVISEDKSWTTTLQSDLTILWKICYWVMIVQASRIARSSDWNEDVALTWQPNSSMSFPSKFLPTKPIAVEPRFKSTITND